MKQALQVQNVIQDRIFLIRGMRVMLDFHLAELYNVETKALKRAVRRNSVRFPADFMFQLSRPEYDSLRYQIGTLKRGEHSKYLPFAFTEQGVAMLSSVLNSTRAVRVNIEIMRAFVRLRDLLSTHRELAKRLDELERRYDKQFAVVFQAIRELMGPPNPPRRQIGFRVKDERGITE